jgi:3-oxoacyl-[acyl-carrier protein] reductase
MLGLDLFRGETAVVTGAASNIGREIAISLAREGATVTISDIDRERLEAVAEDIHEAGGEARAIVADLSERDGWRKIVDHPAAARHDMFVHSACPRRHEVDVVRSVSEETFDKMLNTNVRSGFLLGRELGQRMQAAGIHGRLLYITSLHAHTPRNLPHYSASKAGMTMLMKEMARQFGPNGIRVNAIAPGAIPGGGFATSDDAFQPKRKIPLQRMGTAEDVAEAAMAMLSNRFMKYVTGETLAVDGGLQLFSWIDLPEA